jgi:leucyl aminopeptidase
MNREIHMVAHDKLLLPASSAAKAVLIRIIGKAQAAKVVKQLPPASRSWATAQGFDGSAGGIVVLPADDGTVGEVLCGAGAAPGDVNPFTIGAISAKLPKGTYRLTECPCDRDLVALGWLLEAYRFDRYKQATPCEAKLVCPDGVDRNELLRVADAARLARDLINTPAGDMGPGELEKAALELARRYKAKSRVVTGKSLEKQFPMIHAVGRASVSPPRLIDLTWGPARASKVTLVGKGVCFDTGGLDVKPAAGMLLMKKDMGGAANVLALAQMIMSAGLNVRLRVLIPAVENSIAGNAFRPGDVLTSRNGLTVEIGNTDAEGRLVLADALDLADEEKPDLLIDMATLTGAARVALGPDLPPFYTDNDELAGHIMDHSTAQNDPLWRLPFWTRYEQMLDSKTADINNTGTGGFAGSVTAGLFLRRFVSKARDYVHLDIFGWTPSALPGKPYGGEAQGIRALYALIKDRYAR